MPKQEEKIKEKSKEKSKEKGGERVKEKVLEKGREKIAESIVRVLATNIPGEKNVYYGLTAIKGISFSFSNALCRVLGIEHKRKMSSLTEDEIKKVEDIISNPSLPVFLLNRRKDMETGKDKHVVTTALDLQKEFDIRRLKKIRSYRGWRHAIGLPVRGQRTKAHFRHGATLGVIKEKAKRKESKKE